MTTSMPALARCAVRGCPWRFTGGGPDRMCGHHRDDGGDLGARLNRFADLALPPSREPPSADQP